MSPDDLSSMTGVPVMLSNVVDPGEIFLVGGEPWSSGKVVMHPLDFWEQGTPPGSIERLEKGLDYLLSEANRKLDLLEARLAA